LSRYLLDTSVLSLLVPGRPDVTSEFLEWVAIRDETLHLSTVSVAEIEQGIAKLRRLGGTRKPAAIALWLDDTLSNFAARVLPFDTSAAVIAGALADRALAVGFQPSTPDLYIAATAEAHNLTVLTRNLRHFAPLGITPIDPLVTLPR
jgi:predicted nucleic acid-binding protein